MEMPFNVSRASAETVLALMVMGALQVGEDGLKASEPGIYPRTENIPATDRKSEQG